MPWEIGGRYERPVGAPGSWLAEQLADLRHSVTGPVQVRLFTDGAIPPTTPAVLDEDGELRQDHPLGFDEVAVLKVLGGRGLPRKRGGP
jgi:hypothetical protein